MTDPDLSISRHLHGLLDAEATGELAAWIRADPAHADRFAREVFIASQTARILAGQAGTRRWSAVDGGPDAPTPVHTPDLGGWRHRIGRWRTAAAAAVAVAVGVGWLAHVRHVASLTVATVVGSVDGTGTLPLAPGAGLTRGDYALTTGLARLSLRCGADVVLQGPARVGIDGAHLRLDAGRAVVTCPTPQSRGLVCDVAGAKIVDLGTEFGVDDPPSRGSTDVTVFRGSIRLTTSPDEPGAASSVVLTAGDGRRVDHHLQLAEPLPASNRVPMIRDGQFEAMRRAAGGDAAAGWARYGLGLLRDPQLLLWADFNPTLAGGDGDGATANLADPAGPPLVPGVAGAARFVAGRFGSDDDRAAEFTRPSQPVRVDLPGRFRQLTLAAWVRLYPEPAQAPARHRGLLMSDAWGSPGQVHWQVKGNTLRLSFADRPDDNRFAAACDALTDGNWHLLTTTAEIGPADIHVCHYVDGASISDRRVPVRVPALTLGPSSVGGWRPATGARGDDDRTLNGCVDDLFAWSRTSSDGAVRALFNANAPPGPAR